MRYSIENSWFRRVKQFIYLATDVKRLLVTWFKFKSKIPRTNWENNVHLQFVNDDIYDFVLII